MIFFTQDEFGLDSDYESDNVNKFEFSYALAGALPV